MLDDLEKLISVDDLQTQGFDTVREIHIEEGADSTGDPSYFIWILLDDATSKEALQWSNLEPLVSFVRQKAWSFSREKIYPYVRVQKRADWYAPATR